MVAATHLKSVRFIAEACLFEDDKTLNAPISALSYRLTYLAPIANWAMSN
jgi:hypothetical protein